MRGCELRQGGSGNRTPLPVMGAVSAGEEACRSDFCIEMVKDLVVEGGVGGVRGRGSRVDGGREEGEVLVRSHVDVC